MHHIDAALAEDMRHPPQRPHVEGSAPPQRDHWNPGRLQSAPSGRVVHRGAADDTYLEPRAIEPRGEFDELPTRTHEVEADRHQRDPKTLRAKADGRSVGQRVRDLQDAPSG